MTPNKIIFQIGVLPFCVMAVFLGIQNVSLMETVSRSFIVFVGVVLTVALALITGSMLMTRNGGQMQQPVEKEIKLAQREAAKRPEQAKAAK